MSFSWSCYEGFLINFVDFRMKTFVTENEKTDHLLNSPPDKRINPWLDKVMKNFGYFKQENYIKIFKHWWKWSLSGKGYWLLQWNIDNIIIELLTLLKNITGLLCSELGGEEDVLSTNISYLVSKHHRTLYSCIILSYVVSFLPQI